MEINTQSHKSTLDDDSVIHFPEGLAGFESLKDFKLYNSESEKDLFWLQSVEEDTIEFTVTDPRVFQVNYEVTLSDEEMQLIQTDDDASIIVLVTLSQKDLDNQDSGLHANFLGPIIINVDKKLGLQKALSNTGSDVVIKG